MTEEEIKAFPVVAYQGTNSRARGDRARALGWRPVKTTEDFVESVKAEAEFLIKHSV